ncbi:MATE family efflux transporter [Streptococcus marimammalium]|uniref:MATE family efflux transporter n=1 Tax=Streptococcus marimammalium TaxID=269666 RepID=UPI001E30C209|nr:MATE family efflux transporter [Streptococcus marimammalium]
MSIKRLILNISLPIMFSMLVQALYNIIDSMFVAQINENALAAISLAFPVQNLRIAVAAGTGVGMNALLSKKLGEKDLIGASNAANTGIFLNICHSLLFLVLGLFAIRPLMLLQTSNEIIAEYGQSYITIICVFSFCAFAQITFERLLQSTGRTVLSMYSQVFGAIINIILDPILIFGFFGIPGMGIAGAAIATIMAQAMASLLALYFNIKYNKEITLSLKSILHPIKSTIVKIYSVSIPSTLMVSIGSLMLLIMNQILLGFSTTAVAVFGIYFKLQSFFFMPLFGLNGGLVPVLSYNYGARQKNRIDEAVEFAMLLAITLMVIGLIILELFPKELLSLFNASTKMEAIGISALQIIALSFPMAAVGITISGVFAAFSKSIYSLMTSLFRQLIILSPAAWLLSLTGNVNNVWWAFFVAEVVSMFISLFFYSKIKKNIINMLE